MAFLARPLMGLAMAQIRPLLAAFVREESLGADTIQIDMGGFSLHDVVRSHVLVAVP